MSNTQVIARDRSSGASELAIVVQTICHYPQTTYSSTLDTQRSSGIWTESKADHSPLIKLQCSTLPIPRNRFTKPLPEVLRSLSK